MHCRLPSRRPRAAICAQGGVHVLTARRLTLAALLASAALTAPAKADTLRDAMASAYGTNPNLTAAREGQKATNEGVPLAKANGRPDVTVQPTYFEFPLPPSLQQLYCAPETGPLR